MQTGQSEVRQRDGAVLTCAMADCRFDEGARCGARGITVDQHSNHADCATFRP